MFEVAPLAELIGNLLLVASFFILIYAICSSFVSDETLFDRTLLPSSDPRKLTYYVEPSDPPELYPTVFDDASVYVSFVVPAYNEEKRLPTMLNETLEYLQRRKSEDPNFTYEIIIVDDGSKDGTTRVALDYADQHPEIRLLRQPVNMGKGAAIQAGCLHSRGKMILMVDADGATKIDEFGELEKRMLQSRNSECIVVGSRAHIEEASKAQRTFVRKLLGLGFHTLVLISGVRGVQDTQCGFKLFSREASKWLFPNQHIQRWCFDPELLVIGRKRKMDIIEVPVEWNEIEGSKMKVTAMIKMAIDLMQIAVFHRTGLWTVRAKMSVKEDPEAGN
ncbi:glycosyl transferase [Tritrichomonas foetus]|uniref:dolichyl-phosphate beta-glucosyltransferase n=1 Tax=Tritrichomonas foetus TaxID=1144522 RepID=A0A1J4KH37_9EUKA|nr:glycosyl transferase [Tritrichomonas foetus]|eukprot:OHT10491.1 glycosyl transferase [Tritrichomonas foetus]